jgi:hypothetical protein
MASGSRSDTTVFFLLAVVATLILVFQNSRLFWRLSLLPLAGVIICALLFRSSRSVDAVTGGSDAAITFEKVLSRIAYNITEIPSLWTGIFGQSWGLGWLDTSMPALVWTSGLAAFIGAGFVAARASSMRKAIVIILGALALTAVPLTVLILAGSDVGENFQPRYLLPLMIVFAGVLFFTEHRQVISFNRAQVWLFVIALSGANLIALHLNTRRYVTGIDALAPSLDLGREWWWQIVVSPDIVWGIGVLAFAGALGLILPAHARTGGQIPRRAPLLNR